MKEDISIEIADEEIEVICDELKKTVSFKTFFKKHWFLSLFFIIACMFSGGDY